LRLIFAALVKSKKLILKNLKHFILDECDKMLAELDMRRDVQVRDQNKDPKLFESILYMRKNPKKNMVYGNPMPELIITSPYVHSRVDSNTFCYPLSESTVTICKRRLYPPARDFRFGGLSLCLRIKIQM
jgi:hypothetical protein